MATITVHGIEIPATALSLEGFREWIGSLGESAPRASFCDGRLHVEMSPQNQQTHAPLVKAINRVLEALARAHGIGRYDVPPTWFTDAAASLSTEPDGSLVRWESLRSGRVRINPERKTEMLGAPEMALEVVSDTSERKDLVEHVADYARAGVGEYWIADGRDEAPSLRILVLGTDARYADQPRDAEGWTASPLFGRRFRLRRVVDPAGGTDFELDARAQ